MGFKSRVCKICGDMFHACSSCFLTWEWEYDYCSSKCWETSEERTELLNARKKVTDILTDREWELITKHGLD